MPVAPQPRRQGISTLLLAVGDHLVRMGGLEQHGAIVRVAGGGAVTAG
jgi:hypothetical protein